LLSEKRNNGGPIADGGRPCGNILRHRRADRSACDWRGATHWAHGLERFKILPLLTPRPAIRAKKRMEVIESGIRDAMGAQKKKGPGSGTGFKSKIFFAVLLQSFLDIYRRVPGPRSGAGRSTRGRRAFRTRTRIARKRRWPRPLFRGGLQRKFPLGVRCLARGPANIFPSVFFANSSLARKVRKAAVAPGRASAGKSRRRRGGCLVRVVAVRGRWASVNVFFCKFFQRWIHLTQIRCFS